jgi:homoserine O-acetyltransferase
MYLLPSRPALFASALIRIEQKHIAKHIPDAIYREIHSEAGHDAFLIEFDQLTNLIKSFLSELVE